MADKRRDTEGRILPENVTQRKDGTYMWRKAINGKSYCIYANTLGEIKQKRNVALGEIEAGTYKGKQAKMQEEREQAKKDITLNEWFFQWEKAYRIGKVKESTLQKGRETYMSQFSQNIGRMKMKSIRQIDITSVLNEKSRAGVKHSSLKKYNSILILIFKAALDNGMIDKNPAIGALVVPKDEKKEKRILTEAEEERFMRFIANHKIYNYHVPFFMVAFGTGMRLGELLALQWSDVDFKAGKIRINKSLSYMPDHIKGNGKYYFKIDTPKTKKSIRIIPMTENVKEALLLLRSKKLKCTEAVDGYKDFVFTGLYSHKMSHPAVIRNLLDNIVKALNKQETEAAKAENRQPVIFEKFSPHCMRHTFASRCYERGVKEKVIQEILGHSTLDMTMNTYTHVTEDTIKNELAKME